MNKRTLVTYFSATGTTRGVAERLAHAIGGGSQENHAGTTLYGGRHQHYIASISFLRYNRTR